MPGRRLPPRHVRRRPGDAARQGRASRARSSARTSRSVEQARRAREPPEARSTQRWGVKLDFEEREDEDPRGLRRARSSSSRRRSPSSASALLDLIDRIIGAMVERVVPAAASRRRTGTGAASSRASASTSASSCPTTSTHIARPGDARARALRRSAEKAYEKREKEIGIELLAPRLPPLLPGGDRQGLGRSPHRTWSTCATASASAATARRTRSRSTRRRATTSSST